MRQAGDGAITENHHGAGLFPSTAADNGGAGEDTNGKGSLGKNVNLSESGGPGGSQGAISGGANSSDSRKPASAAAISKVDSEDDLEDLSRYQGSDLSKYLPGGLFDPARHIAGADASG